LAKRKLIGPNLQGWVEFFLSAAVSKSPPFLSKLLTRRDAKVGSEYGDAFFLVTMS
jgi:hypothetical protein